MLDIKISESHETQKQPDVWNDFQKIQQADVCSRLLMGNKPHRCQVLDLEVSNQSVLPGVCVVLV